MSPLNLIRVVSTTQNGVVTAEQCRRAGVSQTQVKSLCRERRWMRLNEGVYFVDPELTGGAPPRLALISAAVLSAGEHAVAVLGTAAELHGLARLRADDAIHVSVPGQYARSRRCTEPAVKLHQLVLRPGDVTSVHGIATTTGVRTLTDVILQLDRYGAVCLLDSGLNRHVIENDDLDLIRAGMKGRRGATRARPWVDECDARAESPLETRVRLRARDGGVPPDELQHRVRDQRGNVVAIGDLLWRRSKIIGEADGVGVHDSPVAVFRDRKRQNDLVAAGYVPVRFTWADTVDPPYVPHVVRSAMARAL